VGGKSKKQTIGYKYYLGMHQILCQGPIDAVTRVTVDDRQAWAGENTGGPITVNAPELFGGESREGGVSGTIDIEMGGPTQGKNSYLLSKLGSLIPAYRGVVGAVFRQCYLGNNPYLKAWRFRGQRIHVRQNGIAQWYDSKAAIANEAFRTPVAGDRGWTDRNTGIFVIGGANEYSGSLTGFQGWWHGNIDSIRITRGQARYTTTTYPVPTTPLTDGENVVLLMQMEGENGSTDFVDAKGHTVTAHGGAAISTARAKFGSSSAYFDGVDDHLRVAMGDDEALGNAWTMEAWVWQDSTGGSAGYQRAIFGYGPQSTGGADTVWWRRNSTWIFGDFIASGLPPFYGAQQNIGPTMELGRWAFVSVCWDGSQFWLHQDGKLLTASAGSGDMNGIHIIRECLTDPDWGMGYTDGDIEDDIWESAADTIAVEGLGMSLLWDRQIKIEEFVDEVKKHIDAAVYVSRETGKFVIKLIRNDYDPDTLLHLDESNIARIEDPSRSSFGELINSVTVKYWDAATGKDASLTITDTAMVQTQGAVINTTVQYPGFTNARNATIAGQRDLKTLSTPGLSCTIYADSDARGLNLGDAFKLSWAKWGLVEVVMRVANIAYGTGRNNQVRIECTQDTFDTNTAVVISVSDNQWEDPSSPPGPSTEQLATEAPYFELVQTLGQSDIDASLVSKPDIGYVIAAASRASSAINARLWTDDGTGYEQVGTFDFCPTAVLSDAITKIQTSFNVEEVEDGDEITVGTHVQVGNELMRVDSIDPDAGTMTVGRGVLDTVPEAHPAGTMLYFWDAYAGFDPTEYVQGEEVDVKITPISGSGTLPLAEAISMTVELDQRAIRPYAPGDLRINGDSYSTSSDYEEELTITWAHRDRLQQTAGVLVDHTAGDIGPEAGTVYRVQGYINGVLEHTEDDIAGTSATWTPEASGTVKIEVHAKRDGILSWQAPWHEFEYGATGRLTEASEKRVTEDDETRDVEE